jgi:hypothetical protein
MRHGVEFVNERKISDCNQIQRWHEKATKNAALADWHSIINLGIFPYFGVPEPYTLEHFLKLEIFS